MSVFIKDILLKKNLNGLSPEIALWDRRHPCQVRDTSPMNRSVKVRSWDQKE